ncbi:MAG: hypothetical protein AAGA25_15600 [Planctomycetota bacterium]
MLQGFLLLLTAACVDCGVPHGVPHHHGPSAASTRVDTPLTGRLFFEGARRGVGRVRGPKAQGDKPAILCSSLAAAFA